jgi:hypothetical protein
MEPSVHIGGEQIMEHPSTSAAFPQEKEEIFRAQRATERPQTGKNPSRDRCPFFCSHGTIEDGCKVYGPYSCIEDPCYSPTEPKYEERSPSSTPSLICSQSPFLIVIVFHIFMKNYYKNRRHREVIEPI